MSDLPEAEYRALRQAIAARGQLRSAVAMAALTIWAGLVTVLVLALAWPVMAVVPLVVLWGAFEIIRPLHVGAERVGRYLQVFYEEREADDHLTPPAWERTAMALGAAVPGAAGHPLFAPMFVAATLANLLVVIVPGPTPSELALLAVPHAAFALWIWRADRAMRAQRGKELAQFRALKERPGA